MKKTIIEYAVQKHARDGWHDVETFNQGNCHWPEPADTWIEKIKQPEWLWDWRERKYGKPLRIVKRTIVEEICK